MHFIIKYCHQSNHEVVLVSSHSRMGIHSADVASSTSDIDSSCNTWSAVTVWSVTQLSSGCIQDRITTSIVNADFESICFWAAHICSFTSSFSIRAITLSIRASTLIGSINKFTPWHDVHPPQLECLVSSAECIDPCCPRMYSQGWCNITRFFRWDDAIW